MTCWEQWKWFWAIFELTSTWRNFAFGKLLTWIMTTYEFLRWISCKVAHIMITREFLRYGKVILSTVQNISNFTYLESLQLYLSEMAPNVTYLGMAKVSYFDASKELFEQQSSRKLLSSPRGLLFIAWCTQNCIR